MKKRVGVVFGGKSVEHEVSVITGLQVIENMDTDKYEPVAIYITKDGRWLTGDKLKDIETFKEEEYEEEGTEIFVAPIPGERNLYAKPEDVGVFGKKIVDTIDLVFPALHGTNGEDGTIQGVFEMMEIPYVGGGVLASSVGMDKILMKDVYRAYDLPVVDYHWFYRRDWKNDKERILEEIKSKLVYPMFVKPSNLGSSIGINIAKDKESLIEAIDIAVEYDRKVIVEQGVVNPREINCAVMGYDDIVETSLCEEPVGWEDILTFEDKYIKSNKGGGKGGGKGDGSDRRQIPADISDELREEVEDLAKKAFTCIDSEGTARIDFLLDEDENLYVNEINTLPGSIGFYLWEGKDYSFEKLIDRLIEIALIKYEEVENTMFNYDANLLNRIEFDSDESVK